MSTRQARYLRLMGITRWRERNALTVPAAVVTASAGPAEVALPAADVPARDLRPPDGQAVNGPSLDKPLSEGLAVAAPSDRRMEHDAPIASVSPTSTLVELAAHVAACTRCGLHASRKQTVFGVGPQRARLMFIGEAPGEREDQQGEPFVGPAGTLLNAMLRAIDLDRDEVYIANILKCRPPRNRDPSAAETEACTPYLLRQLALVQPGLVVALGRVAAQYLLRTTVPLGRLRGRVHDYQPAADATIPFVVTYHPAYLLRAPAEKHRSWEDLKLIRNVLKGSTSAGE